VYSVFVFVVENLGFFFRYYSIGRDAFFGENVSDKGRRVRGTRIDAIIFFFLSFLTSTAVYF